MVSRGPLIPWRPSQVRQVQYDWLSLPGQWRPLETLTRLYHVRVSSERGQPRVTPKAVEYARTRQRWMAVKSPLAVQSVDAE